MYPLVSSVRFTSAPVQDQQSGLVGFVSLLLAGCLRIDGIAVRRTRCGRLVLSFPVRRDAVGREHSVVRPIDDAARRDIEATVLRSLPFLEEAGE
jgi:DNA-binding cell septation regulator SpoVG